MQNELFDVLNKKGQPIARMLEADARAMADEIKGTVEPTGHAYRGRVELAEVTHIVPLPTIGDAAFWDAKPASRETIVSSTPTTETVRTQWGSTTTRRITKATPKANTATDKQLAFLRTLFEERTGIEGIAAMRTELLAEYGAGRLTGAAASAAIEKLLAIPRPRITTSASSDLPDVPAGHYAIASTGDNDLAFYRVDRPTVGDYAGRTFVKLVVGGKPDQNVAYKNVRGILARILEAGVTESATLYGQEIGRCYRCNRTLTDQTSRSLGIGPECRTKA